MGGRILTETEGAGRRFEHAAVIGWAGKTNRNHRLWKCLCDCGNEFTCEMHDLTIGKVKSCGCLREFVWKFGSVTHGAKAEWSDPALTRTWNIWYDMLRRCRDPKNHAFNDYGSRGIDVCADWEDFTAFHRDMGQAPEGFSIERQDVNLGYSKLNCVWIPRRHQNRNKRITIRIRYMDSEWCMRVLCLHLGVGYLKAYKRLKYYGWSLHRALGMPEGSVELISMGIQKEDKNETSSYQ